MNTRISRTAVWQVALLMILGLALNACSGQGSEGPTQSPTPTPSVEVDDKALGQALDELVGSGWSSPDDGRCFVEAVRDVGLSEPALARLVEVGGQDFGSLIQDLSKSVDPEQAELLGSQELRDDLDAYVDTAVTAGSEGGETKESDYKPIGLPERTAEPEPNTTPKYEVDADQEIRSAGDLIEGVISMFSSYADDEEEKAQYAASGECLATVIYNAGFSEETLRFIAGGAPLGSGNVVDHLATDEDKQLWSSTRFSTSLNDCIVDPDIEEDEATQE